MNIAMQAGSYKIYLASSNKTATSLILGFDDAEGQSTVIMDDHVESQVQALAPKTPGLSASVFREARVAGSQGFTGQAYAGFITLEPTTGLMGVVKEIRWSTSGGIFRCDWWPTNSLLPGGYEISGSFFDSGYGGGLNLTAFRTSADAPGPANIVGWWVQRAIGRPGRLWLRNSTPRLVND
ncbi:MAG: hypothetical protein LC624_06995 [Halobacteriales archaeon]|nr:hypothetical protein [Halobacteriales archaeon]